MARERLGDGPRSRYLVMGSVTQFGGEQKTRAGAALGSALIAIAVKRPLLAAFKIKNTQRRISNDDSRRGNRRSRKRCRREIANSPGGRILIGVS